jgi:hypothetical protein
MAVFSKVELSGGTDGRGVKVVAEATLGTTIHTAHATAYDEVYLYAMNSTAAGVLLTIEWGGATDPDDLIEITVPATGAGPTLVIPGWILTNSLVITAFAAAGSPNVITINGWVNRIT